MADPPRLPSVKSLLDMGSPLERTSEGAYNPSSSQHRPTSRPQLPPPPTNYRQRPSARHEPEHAHRSRRSLDLPYRPHHASTVRPTYVPGNPNLVRLPSVSEVLGSSSGGRGPISWTKSVPFQNPAPRHSDATPSKKGYPCERCGRLFTRKSDAQKHIRVVHDRVKNFACTICGRRFGRKDYCTVC